MFEHLLKMLGFKPEHIEEVLTQIKIMVTLATDAVKDSCEQRRDVAFIAAYYRAQIMRHALTSPDDNDMHLIDAYYPVHNPLGTDESDKAADIAQSFNEAASEAPEPSLVAQQIAANMSGENPNIGKS